MWNKVVFADCLEVLPTLGTKSVDLALTDPPFNVHLNKKDKVNYDDSMTDEDYIRWCVKWFEELLRIARRIAVTPGNQNLLMWLSEMRPLEGMLIHHKPNAIGRDPIAMFCTHEVVLLYGDWKHRSFESTVITAMVGQEKFLSHPAPKPLKLFYEIMRQCSAESVIDPFLGSGTTAAAAEMLGIPWIGIELNDAYRSDIEKRLESVRTHSCEANDI